jgi:hypothetical protein
MNKEITIDRYKVTLTEHHMTVVQHHRNGDGTVMEVIEVDPSEIQDFAAAVCYAAGWHRGAGE